MFAVTLILFGWTLRQYWFALPILVTNRLIHYASGLPAFKKIFQSNL
jgi:hypothetical protein